MSGFMIYDPRRRATAVFIGLMLFYPKIYLFAADKKRGSAQSR